MTRQAGMIGGNYSASFESHWLRIYRYVIPNVSRDYTVAGDERECSGSTESRPTNRMRGGFWQGNALRSRKLRAFAEECLPRRIKLRPAGSWVRRRWGWRALKLLLEIIVFCEKDA